MSDATDRRIAELENEVEILRAKLDLQNTTHEVERKINKELHDRDLAHIESLRKQMVQRDVYEAEQHLPPEHAVLIKHLATVERCINEGPVTYHYAEEGDCSFCGEWQGHTRDCAWFALQMDRGVTSVIDDIHAVALQEHERRESQRMPLAGHSHRQSPMTLEQLNSIFREAYGTRVEAEVRGAPMTATEATLRQQNNLAFGNVRVDVNPIAPPGTVYLFQPPREYMNPLEVTRVDMPDHAPVAPPDDEDVP